MREPTRDEVRFAGITSVCYNMLALVATKMPKESGLLHQKAKRQLNNLLSTIVPLIKKVKSKEIILEAEKINGYTIDIEDIHQDNLMHVSMLQDFTEVMLEGNVEKSYALALLLQNIKDGKTLYTQEELDFELNKEK